MFEVLLRLAFRSFVLASSLGEATKSWWQFKRLCFQLCVGKLFCLLFGYVRAPQNESMLAATLFAPEPWQRTLAKVDVRRCGPTRDEGEQVVSPETVSFGRVESHSAAEPQNSRRRRVHIC